MASKWSSDVNATDLEQKWLETSSVLWLQIDEFWIMVNGSNVNHKWESVRT